MCKVIILFFIEACLLLPIKCQNKNLSEFSLKGKVNQLKVLYFDAQKYNFAVLDTIVKGNRKYSYFMSPQIDNTYNQSGNLIEEKKFSLKGEIVSQNIYLYNNDGNLTEYKEIFPKDSIGEIKTYQYDDKGNCLKIIDLTNNSSTIIQEISYKYDSIGQVASMTKYIKGDLFSTTIYDYGLYGYTEEIIFLSLKKVRKYVNNLMKEQLTYGQNGNFLEKRIYEYIENGELLKERVYSPLGKLVHAYNYEYDNEGHKVFFEHYKNGELITRWKYKYTKFDKYGNWVERINHLDLDNGYWYIEERQITYYEDE